MTDEDAAKHEATKLALQAKLQCLEIVSRICTGDPDRVLQDAKKYFDWINESVIDEGKQAAKT